MGGWGGGAWTGGGGCGGWRRCKKLKTSDPDCNM